jgi:Mg-chelatase subunit ChlD
MKICINCGASNLDTAKFCGECGAALVTPRPEPAAPAEKETAREPSSFDLAKLTATLATQVEALQSKRKADIMFVLDCTGSMQGEIDAIKEAFISFADTIEADGVRARVGLIAFWDRLFDQEAEVLTFGGEVFTRDPAAFRGEVARLKAGGGGDLPESSLDAVMLALRQPFDPASSKVLVLVTDAPPHLPDKETKSIKEVVKAIRSVGIQQFYLVIRTQDPDCQIYLKLLEGTRGLAFELGQGDDFRSRAEDFKRTLMSLGKTISAATR